MINSIAYYNGGHGVFAIRSDWGNAMIYQLWGEENFVATSLGGNHMRCRKSTNVAWSAWYTNQGCTGACVWAEMGMLSRWKTGWDQACQTEKSVCQDPHSCDDQPCSSAPDYKPNESCGGHAFWGSTKEGPNGMGRNSPGNMWVRERQP